MTKKIKKVTKVVKNKTTKKTVKAAERTMDDVISGYILIGTVTGLERDVFFSLQKLPEVDEVHLLYGEYDILVKLSGHSAQEVAQKIIQNVRTVKGVTTTKTHIEVIL